MSDIKYDSFFRLLSPNGIDYAVALANEFIRCVTLFKVLFTSKDECELSNHNMKCKNIQEPICISLEVVFVTKSESSL